MNYNNFTQTQDKSQALERAVKVKLLLMDVDGVLTNGNLYYLPGLDGTMVETKGFNSQDGLGLHACHRLGILTGVISGRESAAVIERAKNLNMSYVYQGRLEKEGAFKEILADAKLDPEQVAFIGDDFPDIPLMRMAGLAVAVSNGRPEVKAAAHLITEARGGEGAVREAIEFILKAKDLWTQLQKHYQIDPA